MKRFFVFFLVILLLTVPVSAEGYLVCDDADLLTEAELLELENTYSQYEDTYGFTPVFVTTDSFGGLGFREYAMDHYDRQGYPEDCVYMLISMEERHWYMMTKGICHDRISQEDITTISEAVLEHLTIGDYYEAVATFAETSEQCFKEADDTADSALHPSNVVDAVDTDTATNKNSTKTTVISLLGGMLIGLIAVGIMAAPMKSVKMKQAAADYVRPNSMTVTGCRDIYLYSRVRRSAKPKNSDNNHGRSGSAGGRI